LMAMSRSPAFVYIGGSQPQIPALATLRSLGLAVVLVDRDPPAASVALADHVIVADATATQTIIDRLRPLQADHEILAVYGIADYAAESVAAVAQSFGAAGPSGLEAAHFVDKSRTSELLSAAGLSVPHVYWSGPASRAAESIGVLGELSGPVVVKVTSGNNSKGVRLCLSKDRAMPVSAARDLASQFPDAGLVVEEFVPGEIGNVDYLVLDDTCVPVSSTIRCADPTDPTLSFRLEQPNPHFEALTGDGASPLAELGARVAEALGYKRGPFTIDVVHGRDGQLRILEVSPHFHCLSLDIERGNGNPISAYAAWLRGDPDWRRFLPPEHGAKPGILMQIFSSCCGRVLGFEGEDRMRQEKALRKLVLLAKPGQELRPQGAKDRSAIALAWIVDGNRGAIQAAAERLDGALGVTVEVRA
jgi:carbamoylphosphate synthase large subunit